MTGTINWKKVDFCLRKYFNENEAKYYEYSQRKIVEQKFARWGKNLIKNDACINLIELIGKDYFSSEFKEGRDF